MKKIYSLLMIALLTSPSLNAQSPVPNGGFEQWTNGTFEVPQFFTNTANPETFFKCNTVFNCTKTTDAYHGSFALELTTLAGTDTCMGYALNANPVGNGSPCDWPGGIPFNQTPTGIRGYYKCNVAPGDSAGFLVAFKQNGSCVGFYLHKFGGVQSSYIPFNLTFSPPVMGTPDTMIFAAISSDVFNGVQIPGSMLKIDSISLTGVMSQPAQFNGDFENWQSVNVTKPTDWYFYADDHGTGMTQSTDSYSGTYAMDVYTFPGDNNGVPQANSSGVSTGWWDNNCSCRKGGFPFTNQIDTLAFYYKYAPTPNDSADVSVILKQNGSMIFSTGKRFGQAGSYTYAELPFSSGMLPDSVIVEFRSSEFGNTALNFIGSDLKIDGIHFKSQPTGLSSHNAAEGISVFPNPSANGVFTVKNIGNFDLVRVYNTLGQEVNAQISKEAGNAKVQISTPGAYYIYINASGKVTTQKIVVAGGK